MFLCRRATGLGCKYSWKFAGAAEVGINPPAAQCGAGTLRGSLGSAGYAGGLGTCLNRSYTLFPAGEALGDGLGGRRECGFGGFAWGTLPQTRGFSMFTSVSVSAAAPQFSASRFPGINISLNTRYNACLRAPGYRILSRASSTSQKQPNMEKNQPTPEINQIKPTDVPQGEKEEPEPDKKQNKTAQLKKVFKEYGAVGVSFHIGISLISLGIFYLAVSSGVNMTALLCKLGFSESVVQSKLAAGTSTFVLAYAVHKLFAPVRISITLVSVPLIVRHLRRTGLFKPPSSSL